MRQTQLGRLRQRGIRVSLRLFRPHSIVLRWIGVLLATAGPQAQSLGVSSPRDLLATDPGIFAERLEAARPAPVSALDKARALASLPEEGEVASLAVAARQKLATLSRVIRAADRESVYEVKIISVPQAAVALHARAVLLISERALTLLSAVELQAVVAHEIGHEYVWSEYEQAKRSADRHRRRQLELMCDAIAVVMLHRIELDASGLTRGVEKMSRFNRDRLGTALNEADYPTVAERREQARAVEAWMSLRPRDRKG